MIFVLGLFVAVFTALNSDGYHQEDEHFQILEPSLTLLNGRPIAELPWEFQARMRPSIQIWMTSGVIKAMEFLSLSNRFMQVTLLHLMIGLGCYLLLWRFTRDLMSEVTTSVASLTGFACVAFLWFNPYLNCRNSSELASTAAFMMGVIALPKADQPRSKALAANLTGGFLLAASFWFRFQTAFAIIPFVAYLILARPHWHHHFGYGRLSYKEKSLALGVMLSGAILCSGVAICADRAFYGEWVLTPWRYFSENLLQGKAASFGISPWWGYFRSFFKAAVFPVALLLAIATCYYLIKRRISFVTWVLVFFVAAHSAIAHKELRFIFPLAIFFPVIVASVTDDASRSGLLASRLVQVFIGLVLVINFSALAVSSLLPADVQIKALKELADLSRNQQLIVDTDTQRFASVNNNPFRFYAPNLPPSLFGGSMGTKNSADGFHRIVISPKTSELPPGCVVQARSLLPKIFAYLPEDALYTGRFIPFAILQCQ